MFLSLLLPWASARTYDEQDLRLQIEGLAKEVEEIAGRSFVTLPPLTIDGRSEAWQALREADERLARAMGSPTPEQEDAAFPPEMVALYSESTGAMWILSDNLRRVFAGRSTAANELLLTHTLAHELTHALIDQNLERFGPDNDEAIAVEEGFAEWVGRQVAARRPGAPSDADVALRWIAASTGDSQTLYRYGHGFGFASGWIDTYGVDKMWSLLAGDAPSREQVMAASRAFASAPIYDDAAIGGALEPLGAETAVIAAPFDLARMGGIDELQATGRRACLGAGAAQACVATVVLPTEGLAQRWIAARTALGRLEEATPGFGEAKGSPAGLSDGSVPPPSWTIPLPLAGRLEATTFPEVREVSGLYTGVADRVKEVTFRIRGGRYAELLARRGAVIGVVAAAGRRTPDLDAALARILDGRSARDRTAEEQQADIAAALRPIPVPSASPPAPAAGSWTWRFKAGLRELADGRAAACLPLAIGALFDAPSEERGWAMDLALRCALASNDLPRLALALADVHGAEWAHPLLQLAMAQGDLGAVDRLLAQGDLSPEVRLDAAEALWKAGQPGRARRVLGPTCKELGGGERQARCVALLRELGG